MAGGDVAALIPGPVGIDDLYLLTQPEDQPPTGSQPVPYSGFVIPDDVLNGTAKQHSMAGPDAIDFQALAAANSGVGIVSGCAVSPGGGLLLSVAAGSVAPVAAAATVTVGASMVSVTPDLTLDRWTLICATPTGIVLALPGAPAAPLSTTTPGPVFPTLPTNYVLLAAIYLQAAITQIYAADIVDKRLFVPRTLTTDAIYNGAGTAAAPSYSFLIEPASGLYRAATNRVSLGIAGIEQFRFGITTLSNAVSAALGVFTVFGQLALSASPTFSLSGSALFSSIGIGGTYDFDSSIITSGVWTGVACTANIQATNNAVVASVTGLNFSPTSNNPSASPATITTYTGAKITPTLASSGGSTLTLTDFFGLQIAPINSNLLGNATLTRWTGILVDTGANSTGTGITTAYGLRIASTFSSNLGSVGTIWALAIDSTANNYIAGPSTFGATSAPTWNVHVRGGNAATTGVGIDVSTTGPTVPGSSASGVISIYKGATNWYYLITFNDAGTTRYKYLQLNATGVTWVNNTVLPT